jgi:hypothetical protein
MLGLPVYSECPRGNSYRTADNEVATPICLLRWLMKGLILTVTLAFVPWVVFSNGIGRVDRVKASIIPPSTTQLQSQNASQTDANDKSDIKTFSGRVVLQNGERFILRDAANEAWYHLDDQQLAAKFLGKNVLVTGVLDGATDMIHVRSIAEAKA